MSITIYTTATNAAGAALAAHLTAAGHTFETRDVREDYTAAVALLRATGQFGVPALVTDETVVVGFDPAWIDAALQSVAGAVDARATVEPTPAAGEPEPAPMASPPAAPEREPEPEPARPRVRFGAAIADASQITRQQGGLAIFGAYVGRVAPESPAARLGLRADDIITEINLRPVANAEAFEGAIARLSPGDRVHLAYTRAGRTHHGQTTV